MTCERQADVAAYVLRALDASEADALYAHIRHCEECREELVQLRHPVEVLAQSVAQIAPPRALRTRVMREVRADLRPARRSTRPSSLALAACALAALAVAGGVVVTTGDDERVVAADVRPAGASATLRVSHGRAALHVERMPRAPAGEAYQVWFVAADGRPRPTHTLFNVRDDGRATVQIDDRVDHVQTVLVTAEPSGGSTAPTSTPVITARL
jgi:anti-sigma-K factor RskA